MKLAVHFPHPHLYASATGVGKHMLNMTLGLAQAPGCEVSLLMSRRNLSGQATLWADCPLAAIPVLSLPLSDNGIHRLWKYCGLPSADRWCKGNDWIYCPGETYVATANIPLATTLHAIHFFDEEYLARHGDVGFRERARWKFHLQRIFSKSRVVLTPSEFVRRKLLKLGYGNESQIACVGNGIEESFFEIGTAPQEVTRWPYLIAVGGLWDIKGANEIIALSEALERSAPDLRIVIVGINDPKWSRVASKRKNIHLRGYVGVLDGLPALMRGAVAAVVLSRYETFGIPAAEAMAAGTPVIAANVGALPEIICESGILVNATNADEVAAAVHELVRSQKVRNEYIQRGLLHANNFRWSACVQRLIVTLRDRMP